MDIKESISKLLKNIDGNAEKCLHNKKKWHILVSGDSKIVSVRVKVRQEKGKTETWVIDETWEK